MLKNKTRKEVSLDAETIAILEVQAEKEGRKLKNYMEHILREKANDMELKEEYKVMMDKVLDKHSKGELRYISEEEFRNQTSK